MRIAFTEEEWRNSPFSDVRFYGWQMINGKEFYVVNKDGVSVGELSDVDSPHWVGIGNMAIPEGEPADLVSRSYIPLYQELGREEFWNRTKGFEIKGYKLKDL